MAEYRNALKDLKVVIVDEMSLLSCDLLYELHLRLCQIFQSEDPFANKTIILVGDLLQLKPVMADYIFDKPEDPHKASYYEVAQLWNQFEVFQLKHNHRQGEGNAWANTLNEIRKGIVTEDTMKLLESRVVSENHDEYETCHVMYRNLDVSDHNDKMLNLLKNTDLVEISAIETNPKGFTSFTTPYGTIGDSQFMRVLRLKIGARVVVIININTPDGLVNGAMGTVIGFERNMKHQVECIMVAFDSSDCGEIQRAKYPKISSKYKGSKGTPIFPYELEYQIGKKKNSRPSPKAKVLQFPLRLAWASTAHKMQVSC